MCSIINLRYSGGILLTCMGYTSLKLTASEEQDKEHSEHFKVRPQVGKWRRWKEESQSLAPFLKGIGAPAIATFFVDAILIKNDLSIQIIDDNMLEVTDKTLLGSNVTKVGLGDEELEKTSRTGRKKFMLSAFESYDMDGWNRITVQCRLFQRGPGWYTQQSWIVDNDDVLREQMVLKRADDCDIVVNRAYKRLTGPEHVLGSGNSLSSTEAVKNNQQWNKTIVGLAGIGTVCMLTWFLGPWRSSSSRKDG